MRIEPHPNPGVLVDFDQGCVSSLNHILDKTDAEIVVSSDWKYWVSLEEMGNFYISQGVAKKPIDFTPKLPLAQDEEFKVWRAREIMAWLKKHHETQKWVWVDDLDMRALLGNAAWVDRPESIRSKKRGIIGVENRIIWNLSFPGVAES